MFAQFQARYPTGSLISELLQIYQGKFVVRVSAQVEGVTRSTGMAASEKLELAEDQARSRALIVLGIQPAISAQEVASVPQSTPPHMQMQAVETAFELNKPAYSSFSQASVEEETPDSAVSSDFKEKSDAYGIDSMLRNPVTSTPTVASPETAAENFEIMSGTQTGSSSNPPPISFGNVTPLIPRSYSPQESAGALDQTGAETEMGASEPTDLSDAIARTTVELKRLRWSNQQGREYLVRTYNKRSRQELTDEEMLEFLHFLESQPSP